MKLHLRRDILSPEHTLGTLTIDHEDGRGPLAFGYSVEDTDRNLLASDPVETIQAIKVKHRTAIPVGLFRVRTSWSPKYGRMMPLVEGVPGFQGIRIHSGNDADDSSGCILPGLTRDVARGTVGKSRAACAWLYAELARVEAAGGEVWLSITR